MPLSWSQTSLLPELRTVPCDRQLEEWSRLRADFLDLRRLEFDESVPFAAQARASHGCSVLFGMHGTGLAHVLWMESGSSVAEAGNPSSCETYYRGMVSWYDHG